LGPAGPQLHQSLARSLVATGKSLFLEGQTRPQLRPTAALKRNKHDNNHDCLQDSHSCQINCSSPICKQANFAPRYHSSSLHGDDRGRPEARQEVSATHLRARLRGRGQRRSSECGVWWWCCGALACAPWLIITTLRHPCSTPEGAWKKLLSAQEVRGCINYAGGIPAARMAAGWRIHARAAQRRICLMKLSAFTPLRSYTGAGGIPSRSSTPTHARFHPLPHTHMRTHTHTSHLAAIPNIMRPFGNKRQGWAVIALSLWKCPGAQPHSDDVPPCQSLFVASSTTSCARRALSPPALGSTTSELAGTGEAFRYGAAFRRAKPGKARRSF
jgi:hypothetical protein